ncbi:hypothetical protein VMCG_07581 [Cytospora schulzeri]|uniref:Uncharacterized protein n=1 Tax=Cytospora schulzeri TaxID=448051 RepID=A0A423VXH0_9PEZI|nr:hypothetical protein VMCG_07581 [Valsa malicola]
MKVKELRKVLEHGVSSTIYPESIRDQKVLDGAFRPTTSRGSTTLSSPTAAQSPPSSQRSIATKETAPRLGGTREGSLLCSPLPSPFRRNRTDSKSHANEPISIYQGLVKPIANPMYPLRSNQLNAHDEPKPKVSMQSDRQPGGNKRKTTSWVPLKLRRLSIKRNRNKRTSYEVRPEEESSRNQTNKLSEPPSRKWQPEGEPHPKY